METAVDNSEAENVEMKKEIKTLSEQLEERKIKQKAQAENIKHSGTKYKEKQYKNLRGG